MPAAGQCDLDHSPVGDTVWKSATPLPRTPHKLLLVAEGSAANLLSHATVVARGWRHISEAHLSETFASALADTRSKYGVAEVAEEVGVVSFGLRQEQDMA